MTQNTELGVKKKSIAQHLLIPGLVSSTYVFLVFLCLPFIPEYLKYLGIKPQLMGILLSLTSLVNICFASVMGRLADVIGKRRVIKLGVLALFVGILLHIWPATVFSIILGRIIGGISACTVTTVSFSIVNDAIKDHIGEEKRGLVSGIFLLFGSAFQIVGPVAGGFFAAIFFLLMPFYITLGGSLLFFILLLIFWNDGERFQPALLKEIKLFSGVKEFLSDKRLRMMAISGFGMHTRIAVLNIFLPLFVVTLIKDYRAIGFMFLARSVFGLAQPVFGWIADRIGYGKVLISTTVMSSLMIIIAGFAKSYIFLFIFIALEGFFGWFWSTTAWCFLSEIGQEKDTQCTVLGTYNSLAQWGEFLFSVASGFLVVTFGIPALFVISGALTLLGLIPSAKQFLARDAKRKIASPTMFKTDLSSKPAQS